MNRKLLRRVASVVIVFGIALASGHLVQSHDPNGRTHVVAPPETNAVSAGDVLSGMTGPGAHEGALQVLASDVPALSAEVEATEGGDAAPASADTVCLPRLSLSNLAGATITAHVHAPCAAQKEITLRHAGLVFRHRLDDDGRLAVDLPVLDAMGFVSLQAVHAGMSVPMPPGARDIPRLAVQWAGADGLRLRSDGNDSGFSPASMAVTEEGGEVVLFAADDDAGRIMVYTWPAASDADPVLEARVTAGTCGRDIRARVIHARHGRMAARTLSFAMPGCDALGDVLVIAGLTAADAATDSRLAAN